MLRAMQPSPTLDQGQINFYETFGFLVLRGLFREDVDWITAAFEEVFASETNPRLETHEPLHNEDRRVIIPQFISKHPRLEALLSDRRVVDIVSTLLGEDYQFAESDGNLFDCESHWHSDTYGAPLRIKHLKLSFYLDPLTAESGAIRVIPGTNFFTDPFAKAIRRRTNDPTRIAEEFGVDPRDLPSVALETQPGDLVAWDFRTIHASYYGNERRRLFSINFREHVAVPAAEESVSQPA
jgi:ectoine hydroxylase-related dioxygenase (phytanoyl-CoA dioxygenase family)